MFSNAGRKLASIIKVVTIIVMVTSGLIGFISAIVVSVVARSGGYFFIVFPGTVVVVVLEYVLALFLTGMCEMMADVKELKNRFCDPQATSPSVTNAPTYFNGHLNPYAPVSNISMAAKMAEEEEILRNGGWRCDSCGKVYHGYQTSCTCGAFKPI